MAKKKKKAKRGRPVKDKKKPCPRKPKPKYKAEKAVAGSGERTLPALLREHAHELASKAITLGIAEDKHLMRNFIAEESFALLRNHLKLLPVGAGSHHIDAAVPQGNFGLSLGWVKNSKNLERDVFAALDPSDRVEAPIKTEEDDEADDIGSPESNGFVCNGPGPDAPSAQAAHGYSGATL